MDQAGHHNNSLIQVAKHTYAMHVYLGAQQHGASLYRRAMSIAQAKQLYFRGCSLRRIEIGCINTNRKDFHDMQPSTREGK